MLKFLSVSILLAIAFAAHSQNTVATCPTAAPGTVWAKGAWLPGCPNVVYAAVPLQPTAIVADMRGGSVFSWMLATNVQSNDGIWGKSPTQTAGVWFNAVSPNFAIATSTPPIVVPFTGTAQLSWTLPTANTDGTAVGASEIAGINVYSGSSSTALTKLISLPATALSYAAPIGVGTTYFAISVFTSANPAVESGKSAVVSKTLAAPTAVTPNPPVMTNTAPGAQH